jgi:hypothetical protein
MKKMLILEVIKIGLFALPSGSLVLFMYRYRIPGGIPASSLFFNTGKLIF